MVIAQMETLQSSFQREGTPVGNMWTQINSITTLTSRATHGQINNTVGTVLHIQENKNIKNVKRCRDGMPKSMQTS